MYPENVEITQEEHIYFNDKGLFWFKLNSYLEEHAKGGQTSSSFGSIYIYVFSKNNLHFESLSTDALNASHLVYEFLNFVLSDYLTDIQYKSYK